MPGVDAEVEVDGVKVEEVADWDTRAVSSASLTCSDDNSMSIVFFVRVLAWSAKLLSVCKEASWDWREVRKDVVEARFWRRVDVNERSVESNECSA